MEEYDFTLWADKDRLRHYNVLMDQVETCFLEFSKEWDITIKPHKRHKTQSQRGWFHKLCQIFGDEIGLTQGQVKDVAKAQIVGWRHVKFGGIDIVVPDGSSEDLSKLEYSDLIESLYRLAAESGVALPPPDITKSAKWRRE